ncbi:MAG TPA: hypothetical protein VFA27_07850 [Vicinamibacterales bacterium]|nr:hypothetical protein [Vicinamibacterales bacterium]
MARGFESKDVEFQQAEAERTRKIARGGPDPTPEERAAETQRRTLALALTRKRAELAAARSDAHRRTLTAAIDALEHELARLS